jgi:hypothetical protein
MSIYDKLKSLITTPAVPMTTFQVDPPKCDVRLNATPLAANQHYIRVRLARMFLRDQSTWTQRWFPAVQSHIAFQFGDGRAEIPNVADVNRTQLQNSSNGDLIIRNVPLTPVVPFHGGLVEISVSLLAIKGENGLNKFIGVLGGFSEVLQIPQFSAALKIAAPLTNGLNVLLDTASDHLHLGYFNSFGAGQLQDGYIAILRTPQANINKGRLFVVQDVLCEGDTLSAGDHQEFTGCDYMLLRIEIFEHRDDFESLTRISEIWKEVENTMGEQRPDWEIKAKEQMRSLLLSVIQADELTRGDRVRIGNEFRARFEDLKQQFSANGAVASGWPSLAEIDERARMPRTMDTNNLKAELSKMCDGLE